MAMNSQRGKGVFSELIIRRQHGFDTAAYTKIDPPGAASDWGGVSYIRLPCSLLLFVCHCSIFAAD